MKRQIESLDFPLKKEEAKLIVNLEEEAFGPGALDIFEVPAFSLFGKVFLFYLDEKIAGHAIITRFYEKDAAYIYSFALRNEFRGKGHSKYFLEMLLNEIKKSTQVVYLTVRPDNTPALNVYKKVGFHSVELLKDFYGEGEDRYLMMLVFSQEGAP
ncbi:MAG: GNAT family N-acetyltransferase [Actinobacteria bacterium]|nr:GNAT family N-acetyltransferase [Actinomycetota bacterium]